MKVHVCSTSGCVKFALGDQRGEKLDVDMTADEVIEFVKENGPCSIDWYDFRRSEGYLLLEVYDGYRE